MVVTRAGKDEAWSAGSVPEGQRVKSDRVSSLLSNFGNLRFTDTLAPDDEKVLAAREHSRALRFTTFDGKSWTVTLGRQPEEKRPKTTGNNTRDDGTAADPVGPALAQGQSEVGSVGSDAPTDPSEPAPAEPKEPEFETIPAGPVFVTITSSDESARINALMQRRAFQISEWTYTSLPQSPAEFFEAAPPAQTATGAKSQ